MKRKRTSRWLVGLGVLLVGGLATLVVARATSRQVTHSLGSLHIQVVGQVVDAQTGQPLQGATVHILRHYKQALAEKELERLHTRAAEEPALSVHPHWVRHTSTGADGRFDLTVENTYCTASGPVIIEREPEAFYGARTVAVEADGYELTFFSATKSGSWRVLNPSRDTAPYGLVDARTLHLPPVN